ncbi:MAG: LysM peptidoglycan-binding domain-containing protein [Elusimicrobia bacterium]|nr:LysM peptidoglycan-binding domain-containing protein [Elusimicrobiota bacterium]
MKFIIASAVILTLNGFLNAQQTNLLGEDDRKTPAQTSTKTVIIAPTPGEETPAAESTSLVEGTAAAESAAPVKAAPADVKPAEANKDADGFMVDKKHAVTRGDTLWDLSRKYYGDPFKWGRIYNANTGTIKVPDLIYPLDELVIPDITEEIKPEPAPSARSLVNPDTITDTARDVEALSAAMPAPPAAGGAKAPVSGVENAGKAQGKQLSEQFIDFEVTDLSEEMPEDMKEWQTNVKIVPDSWTESGVITAKESVGGSEYSLAFNGEIMLVRVASPAAFKPGDILTSYLKGSSAFDKKGRRLGREIQKTGTLTVISVNGDIVKARIIDASTSINKGQVVKK